MHDDKQLGVTNYVEVINKLLLPVLSVIAPCAHEEADSYMSFPVAHATKTGYQKIMIQTVETWFHRR